jgi:hypothetical protein
LTLAVAIKIPAGALSGIAAFARDSVIAIGDGGGADMLYKVGFDDVTGIGDNR